MRQDEERKFEKVVGQEVIIKDDLMIVVDMVLIFNHC